MVNQLIDDKLIDKMELLIDNAKNNKKCHHQPNIVNLIN